MDHDTSGSASPLIVPASRVCDATIAITDHAMRRVYRGELLDTASTDVLDDERVRRLNMVASVRDVLDVFRGLPRRFFLLCGSSNFHHLDIGFLTNLREAGVGPVQLVLLDRHMDAQRYREATGMLHCGNWVSYACRTGLVSHGVLVGCRDYRRFRDYDLELFRQGRLRYHPDLSLELPADAIDTNCPTYVSIDTDILSVRSDWGRGQHTLGAVCGAALWRQLGALPIAGASLQGHVTDARMALDCLLCSLHCGGLVGKLPLQDQVHGFVYTFTAKLLGSLCGSPLSLERQAQIMLTLVSLVGRAARHPSYRVIDAA